MKKKILLTITAIASVLALSGCNFEDAKLRKEHINQANQYIAAGDTLEGLKELNAAKNIKDFDEKEEAYKAKFTSLLEKEFSSNVEKGDEALEEFDYKTAKEHYNIVLDLFETINFPFSAEQVDQIKEQAKYIEKKYNETLKFNEVYQVIKSITVSNDETITKYLELVDKKRNNTVSVEDFNAKLAELRLKIKNIGEEIDLIDKTNQNYFTYYSQMYDFNTNLLELTYSNSEEQLQQLTVTLNQYKKNNLTIELNFIKFGEENEVLVNNK